MESLGHQFSLEGGLQVSQEEVEVVEEVKEVRIIKEDDLSSLGQEFPALLFIQQFNRLYLFCLHICNQTLVLYFEVRYFFGMGGPDLIQL